MVFCKDCAHRANEWYSEHNFKRVCRHPENILRVFNYEERYLNRPEEINKNKDCNWFQPE